MPQFELFADEAWTHGGDRPFRYHCFYGGICGPSSQIAQLDTALRKVILASGLSTEVKWSNLGPRTDATFREIVARTLEYLASPKHQITYRQMFCDRAFQRVPATGEPPVSPLDVQFKLCYQFIKFAFGLHYLPKQVPPGRNQVLVRLDTHSSQKHKDRLVGYVAQLGTTLCRPDLHFRVTFMDSARSPCIQACDLLMGAAGSYGNKMHCRRPNGRGMSPNQKMRFEFAKFVYDKLRDLNNATRGKGAFNWFESTGHDGMAQNRLHQKLRIWKFQPQRYRIDKGWQNDNLDKQGLFVASDVQPEIQTAGGQTDFTY